MRTIRAAGERLNSRRDEGVGNIKRESEIPGDPAPQRSSALPVPGSYPKASASGAVAIAC